MLTFKNLKAGFEAPIMRHRPPTPKALRDSGEIIVLHKEVSPESDISVYCSGYVLYRSGSKCSVFHVHDCGDYEYGAAAGRAEILEEAYFENREWYLRILLEGEDRIEQNQNNRETSGRISYSAIGEDWSELADRSEDVLGGLLLSETICELLSGLTKKQRYVVYHHTVIGKTQTQIAKELGVDTSTISKIFNQGLRRIRRRCCSVDNQKIA